MATDRPLVSVVMSVYNSARTLCFAIDSILVQSYGAFEIIIMNDGSTDDTWSILERYAAKHSSIHLYRHASRLGLTRSLVELCGYASGEYIARMDADDISLPQRFETQVQYLSVHPQVALCGTQGWYIDEQGRQVGPKDVSLSQPITKRELLWNNQCIHSSWMVRKVVLDDVGCYDNLFAKSQDYELLLRIASRHQVVNLPQRLIQWRVSPHSLSWQNREQERYALRARWYAITQYQYPIVYGIWCIIVRSIWYGVPLYFKRRRYA